METIDSETCDICTSLQQKVVCFVVQDHEEGIRVSMCDSCVRNAAVALGIIPGVE